MRGSTSVAAVVGLLAALAPFAAAETLCDANTKCPESAPCCSPYGYCNAADSAVCLGGCQPWYSFKETSCKPAPSCVEFTTQFTDLSRVVNITDYKGNASRSDWTVETGKLVPDPEGNGVRLLLTQDGGDAPKGTKISSTRYVHYGQIDFEMQVSKWGGVVTAAITMSDVKDEIDWEWVSRNTSEAQSNFFSLGNITYTDGKSFEGLSDTSTNFHVYTLNWQEDELQWIIDGKVYRTLKKSDTLGSDGRYRYPSTPSRVEVSIWGAGTDAFAKGTVDWAGGMIDWSDADYAANGYFHNTVKSISIRCADSADAAAAASSMTYITGYQYNGNDSTNAPVVSFTNRSTILGVNGATAKAASLSFVGILAVAAIPSFMALF